MGRDQRSRAFTRGMLTTELIFVCLLLPSCTCSRRAEKPIVSGEEDAGSDAGTGRIDEDANEPANEDSGVEKTLDGASDVKIKRDSANSVCGNGVVEGDEACDGLDTNGMTCADIDPNLLGRLRCTDTCRFDTDECVEKNACVPDCADRECGSDGCDGSCAPGCGKRETCHEPSGRCYPVGPPSCESMEPMCNDNGMRISCCDAQRVPGGTFPMGRGNDTDAFQGEPDERPEHDVTVSEFYLDTFEVTVGRFRRFVDAYDRIAKPRYGEGAHPLVPESGWQDSWQVPANRDRLIEQITCSNHTWTDTAGENELLPINCISWELAFFFCYWDEGRLPTEAEWEYAAAGGSENRLYPWGSDRPDPRRAVFDCMADGVIDCTLSDILEVGSAPLGMSRWGQYDMSGSVWEWALDLYDADFYSGIETCQDCANLQTGDFRVVRGGSWNYFDYNLRSVYRKYIPDYHFYSMGIRCARDHLATQ